MSGLWCWITSNHDALLVVFTFLLFIGTAALAIYTGMLWRSTGTLVRDAAKTAERQLRAYVSIKGHWIVPVDDFGVPIAGSSAMPTQLVQFTWKNTGSTPTRHARTNINYALLDGDIALPTEFSFQDGPKTQVVFLGPRLTVSVDGFRVNKQEATDVLMRKKSLYVWGWIEYNDVFDGTPRRRTEFSWRVFIKGNPSLMSPLLYEWEPTEKHNGADEDCYRKQ